MDAFGVFAIDTCLPGFPRIARDLGTTIGPVHINLAMFLLGLAIDQFLGGTLIDHVAQLTPLLAC